MGRKVIICNLYSDIDLAIREINDYKRDFIRKTEQLREKVAEFIRKDAQSEFNGAILDDLLSGGARYADVDVSVSDEGSVTLVIANGEDAIWVEFGTGVYHNGSTGSSPHPKGSELGFTIGGYGKGLGKKETWGFYEDGELMFTHGTPSVMPMYTAMVRACDKVNTIAKEVFG